MLSGYVSTVDLQQNKSGDILALIVVWHIWLLRRCVCPSWRCPRTRTPRFIVFPRPRKTKRLWLTGVFLLSWFTARVWLLPTGSTQVIKQWHKSSRKRLHCCWLTPRRTWCTPHVLRCRLINQLPLNCSFQTWCAGKCSTQPWWLELRCGWE